MMARIGWPGLAAIMISAAFACRSQGRTDAFSRSVDASDSAPRDAGGSLTDRQVEMYVAVRTRTVEILDDRDPAIPSVVYLPTAQSEAIEELGYEPNEFQRAAALIDASRSSSGSPRMENLERAIAGAAPARLAQELRRADSVPFQRARLGVRLDKDALDRNRELLDRHAAELDAIDSSLRDLERAGSSSPLRDR